MSKKKVLFVCIHNSARSQMAEALLNEIAGDSFAAESARIRPGNMNAVVVQAMQEIGIDLSKRATKSVDAMITRGILSITSSPSATKQALNVVPSFPAPASACNGPSPILPPSVAPKKTNWLRRARSATKSVGKSPAG